jgi:hypothetical protein
LRLAAAQEQRQREQGQEPEARALRRFAGLGTSRFPSLPHVGEDVAFEARDPLLLGR